MDRPDYRLCFISATTPAINPISLLAPVGTNAIWTECCASNSASYRRKDWSHICTTYAPYMYAHTSGKTDRIRIYLHINIRAHYLYTDIWASPWTLAKGSGRAGAPTNTDAPDGRRPNPGFFYTHSHIYLIVLILLLWIPGTDAITFSIFALIFQLVEIEPYFLCSSVSVQYCVRYGVSLAQRNSATNPNRGYVSNMLDVR